ncbi:hypothetical protein L1887_30818 [Cichorium endivia]|nr:hypothetical protein L1887_30818 [Cichorium endivia]
MTKSPSSIFVNRKSNHLPSKSEFKVERKTQRLEKTTHIRNEIDQLSFQSEQLNVHCCVKVANQCVQSEQLNCEFNQVKFTQRWRRRRNSSWSSKVLPLWVVTGPPLFPIILRELSAVRIFPSSLPSLITPFSSNLLSVHDAAFLVQRGGWIKNADYFMDLLTAMNFSGGGFNDVSITEGLAEVLMMCPVHGNQNHQQNVGLQKHCILVAASNPYPLPTPVYIQSESHLSDAETVAKYFKQCLVSLSVICPRQLPKLKAIFNAGKRNPNSAIDQTVDIVTNPNYTVLISEDFMEARAALSRPEIPNLNLPPNLDPMTIDLDLSILDNLDLSILDLDLSIIFEEPSTGSSMESASSSSLSTPQEMTTSVPVVQTVTPTGQAESATLPGTSTATTVPTTGMQSLVITDNVATNVGPAQETSTALQSKQPKFIKLWEGFREMKDSESLASDWPSTMKVYRVVPQDQVKNHIYSGKVDYVCFQATNEHKFLKKMQEKKLYSVVKLPSNMMLLYSSDNPCRLVGMLFPKDKIILLVPGLINDTVASIEVVAVEFQLFPWHFHSKP